jgi:hypothetical protein
MKMQPIDPGSTDAERGPVANCRQTPLRAHRTKVLELTVIQIEHWTSGTLHSVGTALNSRQVP